MESITGFFSGQPAQENITQFLIALGLATVFSLLLGEAYVRFGKAVTSRRSLAGNFILITLTTLLIISVVKSSIALSLGLVGALSIVRFRAAIKDPEELAFLFLAIAIGLGFGANQVVLTIVAVSFVLIVLIVRHMIRGRTSRPNLYLTVHTSKSEKVAVAEIAEVLKGCCSVAKMTHLSEDNMDLEISFEVEFTSFDEMLKGKDLLREMDEGIRVTLIDHQGLS